MNRLGQLTLLGIDGKKFTKEHESFIREMEPGGIIIFRRNYESPKKLLRFVEDLQLAAANAELPPLMISVDQEGGRVARLQEPFTRVPPMKALGAAAVEKPGLAFEVGRMLGLELSAVGINCDHAPVLDVATNHANPVIGDRAFSSDPDVVSRLAVEMIRGLQEAGVAACGKHFPGHGDTDVDSHLGLPVLPHTRARFDACELLPFRAAVGAGVASIMTAHLLIPNLDSSRPATISRRITTGILREELRFSGLVFTDCLTMEGIANLHPAGEAAPLAIAAGADVAIVCHDPAKQRAALDGLSRALDEGLLSESRIEASLSRIERFKELYCSAGRPDFVRPPLSIIGCRDHRRIVEGIRW